MEKWRVQVVEEAVRELEIAVRDHPDLKPDILARLAVLADFPPEKWFFVFKHRGLELFRAETGQLIRISGQADPDARIVTITHIHVVRKRP